MFNKIAKIAALATLAANVTGAAFAEGGDNGSGLQPLVPALGCAEPCTTSSTTDENGVVVYGDTVSKASGSVIRTADQNNAKAAKLRARNSAAN